MEAEGSQEQVGNHEPTGNQCEYFAAELRSCPGSRERIREFHTRARIRNPLNGLPLPVQLAFLKNGTFLQAELLPAPFREPGPWSLPEGTPSDDFYVVFVQSGGHDPGCDYRCNWRPISDALDRRSRRSRSLPGTARIGAGTGAEAGTGAGTGAGRGAQTLS